MIYRRDNSNRTLDDFCEAKGRSGLKPGRKPERTPRSAAVPSLASTPSALAAAPALK